MKTELTLSAQSVTMKTMAKPLTEQDLAERRDRVLLAARWCFLNFGFSKTSLDDIAKRAGISRTLLYKSFSDKEDIFTAVFAHWLVSRHPLAQAAAAAKGSPFDRLVTICKVMVVEPWEDMVGAPMAAEFHDVCERLDPEISAHHRRLATQCIQQVLGGSGAAEVFVLALDGQLADEPSVEVLSDRIEILASSFTKLCS